MEAFKSLMDVSSVDDSFSFYDLLAKRTEMFDENDIEEGVQQVLRSGPPCSESLGADGTGRGGRKADRPSGL